MRLLVAAREGKLLGGLDVKICWWCGINPASSREHRIKRSRLEAETSSGGPLTYFAAGFRPTTLRSTDAQAVKFGKTLCQPCNSTRSQPFDAAYDHFVGWTKANRERLRTVPHIDWSEVFAETNYDNRHLARYYVKNMCCRIVDSGADVPKQLVTFLDDLDAESPLGVIIYRDYGPDEVTSDGILSDPFASRTSQGSGELLENTNEPSAFFTIIEDGFIGCLVGYYAPPYRPAYQESISRGTRSPIYEPKRQLMWAAPLFKDKWFLEHAIQEKQRLGRDLSEEEVQGIADSFNSIPPFVPLAIESPPSTVDPLEWLTAQVSFNSASHLVGGSVSKFDFPVHASRPKRFSPRQALLLLIQQVRKVLMRL